MKLNRLTKLTLLLSYLGLQSFPAMAYDSGRIFVWGLGGSRGIARTDALIPIISNQTNSLFYADIQGKIGSDSAYFGGVGFRYLAGDVNSVSFAGDISLGLRVLELSDGQQTWRAWNWEWVRLGFGVDEGIENRQDTLVGADDGRLHFDVSGGCIAIVHIATKRQRR